MDKKLLDILVCPVTKGPLTYDKEHQELISKSARLAYPIRDGIPVMLEEEARAHFTRRRRRPSGNRLRYLRRACGEQRQHRHDHPDAGA